MLILGKHVRLTGELRELGGITFFEARFIRANWKAFKDGGPILYLEGAAALRRACVEQVNWYIWKRNVFEDYPKQPVVRADGSIWKDRPFIKYDDRKRGRIKQSGPHEFVVYTDNLTRKPKR